MSLYRVTLREVWYQPVLVEAGDPVQAERMALGGEGICEDNMLEYSHTLNEVSDVEEVGA